MGRLPLMESGTSLGNARGSFSFIRSSCLIGNGGRVRAPGVGSPGRNPQRLVSGSDLSLVMAMAAGVDLMDIIITVMMTAATLRDCYPSRSDWIMENQVIKDGSEGGSNNAPIACQSYQQQSWWLYWLWLAQQRRRRRRSTSIIFSPYPVTGTPFSDTNNGITASLVRLPLGRTMLVYLWSML